MADTQTVLDALHAHIRESAEPVATARDLEQRPELDYGSRAILERLHRLEAAGRVRSKTAGARSLVWYPADPSALASAIQHQPADAPDTPDASAAAQPRAQQSPTTSGSEPTDSSARQHAPETPADSARERDTTDAPADDSADTTADAPAAPRAALRQHAREHGATDAQADAIADALADFTPGRSHEGRAARRREAARILATLATANAALSRSDFVDRLHDSRPSELADAGERSWWERLGQDAIAAARNHDIVEYQRGSGYIWIQEPEA